MRSSNVVVPMVGVISAGLLFVAVIWSPLPSEPPADSTSVEANALAAWPGEAIEVRRPTTPGALFSFTSNHAAKTNDAYVSQATVDPEYEWFMQSARHSLARCSWALERGIFTTASGAAEHARSLAISAALLPGLGNSSAAAIKFLEREDPWRHSEATAATIDAVRGHVNSTGFGILLLAEAYYADAHASLETVFKTPDRVQQNASETYTLYQLAFNAIGINVQLESVMAMVEIASRYPGTVAPPPDISRLLAEAKAEVEVIPRNTSLETSTNSAYLRAKYEFPHAMEILLSRNWTEGAADAALETLLYTEVLRMLDSGEEPHGDELVEALNRTMDGATVLDIRMTGRAWDAYYDAENDPEWGVLVGASAKMAPLRNAVHSSMLTGEQVDWAAFWPVESAG